MSEAFAAKLGRVRALMDEQGFGALVLSRFDNIAWLTGGADTHVGLTTEQAVVSLVITRDEVVAVTTNIEAPRLGDEEFAGLGIAVRDVRWWDGSVDAVVAELSAGEDRVGSDVPAAGRELVSLSRLRYALSAEEVAVYRALGADMGTAVGEVAQQFGRGESEFSLAGRLARALLEREITPVVLLVAADERIARYRHPIPTAKAVEEMAMLVACGRRRGLIVALTRLARFGAVPPELRRRHDAVCAVDATFIAHTVPGTAVAAVFAAGVAAYERYGFAGEWQHHHQGGATGYAGRDYRATFDSPDVVQPWQAFAWNPSIAGTKSEDTMLATPDGPEVISGSPDWPLLTLEVAGRRIARPDILVR